MNSSKRNWEISNCNTVNENFNGKTCSGSFSIGLKTPVWRLILDDFDQIKHITDVTKTI